MQKKQKTQFIVLLVLIAALVGAYFGIRTFNEKQEQKKEQEEAAATITLTSFDAADVTAIRYDYDGTDYEFEKDGNQWKDVNDKELSLDQDAFESFLQSAGSITADTEVAAEQDADYGFDEPTRIVTITTKNGTSSLTFGMENEMLSQYYVKTSESSKIYLAEQSVYTIFDKAAQDFEAEDTQTDTDTDKETSTANTK